MAFNGMIQFRNTNLSDIQHQTTGQQDEYTQIWNDVYTQLMGLVADGQVDPALGDIVERRNLAFQQQAAGYDEGVIAQNRAVGQVQTIGNDGGEAMRRAAAGGMA
jgi:hypothetical protein